MVLAMSRISIHPFNVLVTGGAGFIGSALAKKLVSNGAHVTILDLPEKLERISIDPTISVVAGDIARRDTFVVLSRRGHFDAVLHLAAQSSARISHDQPEKDIDTNAKGTLLLIEWCREQGIDRVLYASSMAVYGEPKQLPVTEESPPAPLSYYGVSKLAGEYYIKANASTGLHYTIFRLFNVYGPGQDMQNLKQGMASIYLAYVMKKQEVPVTGSLERFRDFIYIDDVVDAWLRALHDKRAYNKIYNLGSGIKTTVRELLDIIITAYGYDPTTYPVRNIGGHPGDQFGIVSDISRFQQDFNWVPRISLKEGIARMVAWLTEENCEVIP